MKFLLLIFLCLIYTIHAQVRWVRSSGGRVPNNALVAGNRNGYQLLLCRGVVEGNQIAGKIETANPYCLIALDEEVRNVTDYDVATATTAVTWLATTHTNAIPTNAALVGFDAQRQATYACRANHLTWLIPGWVDSAQICWIAVGGQEFRYATYAILLG